MIPAIMRKEIARLEPQMDAAQRTRQAEKESAAITGFTSPSPPTEPFHPQILRTSIALTGGVSARCGAFFRLLRDLRPRHLGVYTRKAASCTTSTRVATPSLA